MAAGVSGAAGVGFGVGGVQVREQAARSVQVSRCRGRGGVGRGQAALVGADGQDAFHGAVGRIIDLQRAGAGGLEPVRAIAVDQGEDERLSQRAGQFLGPATEDSTFNIRSMLDEPLSRVGRWNDDLFNRWSDQQRTPW